LLRPRPDTRQKHLVYALTIAVLVEEGKCLLELSNLFFSELISHGYRFQCKVGKGVLSLRLCWCIPGTEAS